MVKFQMALRESLIKFKQQQAKCQSTLTSISARAAPSWKLHNKTAPTHISPPPAKAPTPPLKFSNDIARLQQADNIRNSPVGAQLKWVVDLLYERREALTAEEIHEACRVDIKGNKAVFNSLRNNEKVSYDGRRFSYKAKHYLEGKDGLLSLIRKSPEGLRVVDVKDAYLSVMDDLQALKAAGQVWLLSDTDSKEDIVYPNDPRVTIMVDDDLKQLFRSQELPLDMLDIGKYLLKNLMKPATDTTKRRAMAELHGKPTEPKKQKKKERDITKRTKLTNAHLPELFNL